MNLFPALPQRVRSQARATDHRPNRQRTISQSRSSEFVEPVLTLDSARRGARQEEADRGPVRQVQGQSQGGGRRPEVSRALWLRRFF